MPPDPYAVIISTLVGMIAAGLGSRLLLTGCIKRKNSQKRTAKGTAPQTDISGEAAEINSSGGAAVSGGTAGSVPATPAKPIKSIVPVAVTPDKPGGSANSKTNHRGKGSHKEEVEGESHDVSGGQARDSETKDKQKASVEPVKKSNQKILDEKEDKIAKGLVVRRQSDYPAMDDILSDWDESESPNKKSKKSRKDAPEGVSNEKKKGKRRKNGASKTLTMTIDQTQITRTRDK